MWYLACEDLLAFVERDSVGVWCRQGNSQETQREMKAKGKPQTGGTDETMKRRGKHSESF